jgi:hypothetical protein
LKPHEISAELMLQIRKDRAAIERELDSLAAQHDRLTAAAAEDTLCGHLRRAVHASRRSLAAIARDAGMEPDALSGFMEGSHSLPSESLDRLAQAAGVVVTMMQSE